MEKQKTDSAITYHNKDVISKLFGEKLKNKSFEVYGLQIPEITEVLPTNLPAVEANEMRLDNLFRLKDDSLALVDYESTYDYEDKIKYLNYIARTLKRYKAFTNPKQIIHMIVIYTGDVEKGKTIDKLDVGCLQLKVEEVFLSELNAEAIETDLYQKIHVGKSLSGQEQMQFIILPLIYKGTEAKQNCIQRCFEMGKKIESREIQTFVFTGLLVFTDKVIRKEDSEKIRRWIEMTKVGQIIEEEIQQAIAEMRRQADEKIKEAQRQADEEVKEAQRQADEEVKEAQRQADEEVKEAQRQADEEVKEAQRQADEKVKVTARKMLECGISIDQILQCINGLTRGELERMK